MIENGASMQAVLIYDGLCAVCKSMAGSLSRWDVRQTLECIELQNPRAEKLFAGYAASELKGTFHLIREDGQVFSGKSAIPEIIRRMRLGSFFAWCLTRIRAIASKF